MTTLKSLVQMYLFLTTSMLLTTNNSFLNDNKHVIKCFFSNKFNVVKMNKKHNFSVTLDVAAINETFSNNSVVGMK